MSWLQIDDGFAEHPKVEPLSDAAFRLHVEGMCYCARNLTDGRIGKRLCSNARTCRELVLAKVWEVDKDEAYWVHDYLDHNPSREEVLRKREEVRARKERWRSQRTERETVRETNTPPTPTPTPTPTPEEDSAPSSLAETQKPRASPHHAMMAALKEEHEAAFGSPPATKGWGGRWANRVVKPLLIKGEEPDVFRLKVRHFCELCRDRQIAFNPAPFLERYGQLNGEAKAEKPSIWEGWPDKEEPT